jgi:cytochrome c556
MTKLLAAATACMALLAAWLGYQLHQAQGELAAERQAMLKVALAYADNAHKTTAQWAGKVSRAQQDRQLEIQAVERLADDLRAERDGMRDDIADYVAGCAGDSLAACSERAAALGELLDRALQADARSAGAAEEHARDVRALLSAWPVAEPSNPR